MRAKFYNISILISLVQMHFNRKEAGSPLLQVTAKTENAAAINESVNFELLYSSSKCFNFSKILCSHRLLVHKIYPLLNAGLELWLEGFQRFLFVLSQNFKFRFDQSLNPIPSQLNP